MAQDQKQEVIIEKGCKAFAHFDVSKKTMMEFAGYVSFSKASLYYHFPDKLNLYAAVFNTITEADATKHDKVLQVEKYSSLVAVLNAGSSTGDVLYLLHAHEKCKEG